MMATRSCGFFFQAEDGIRDRTVTGVQTCALPISRSRKAWIILPDHYQTIRTNVLQRGQHDTLHYAEHRGVSADAEGEGEHGNRRKPWRFTQHAQAEAQEIGRASCRESVEKEEG